MLKFPKKTTNYKKKDTPQIRKIATIKKLCFFFDVKTPKTNVKRFENEIETK